MKHTLMSPEDVLNKLGADDFRSINKNQLIEFVSSIPDMDKETALKCIEQFPEFTKSASIMINELSNQCALALEHHKAGHEDAVEAYQFALTNMSDILNKPEITPEERQWIIDKMIEVSDKVAEMARNNDNFLQAIISKVGTVVSVAIIAGAGILGVKIYRDNN